MLGERDTERVVCLGRVGRELDEAPEMDDGLGVAPLLDERGPEVDA